MIDDQPGDDLAGLLRRRTPFLDVRAPAEYARGALPHSDNLPILDDDERAQVGIEGWRRWCERHPDGWLTCWRGGERSAIAQRWLADVGVDVRRVDGGFKALRRLCLDVIAAAPDRYRWLVEEYRVSVFAQKLGTAEKVSDKRLAEAWRSVGC